MNITDEMIQKATNAVAYLDRTCGPDSNGRLRYTPKDYAEAALTAALGDVEYLEDVIGDLKIMEIWKVDDEWRAIVHPTANPGAYSYGTGPTIDAAIRAAVASAKGGE